MIPFRRKKKNPFFILVLHHYLSICFTAVLQVSNLRLIKCRHSCKPWVWFARSTTVLWGCEKWNKVMKTVHYSLGCTAKFSVGVPPLTFVRWCRRNLWPGGVILNVSEKQHTNSKSRSMAMFDQKRGLSLTYLTWLLPYLLHRMSGIENIGKKRYLKVTANSTFTTLL